jgi:hypothetical protein
MNIAVASMQRFVFGAMARTGRRLPNTSEDEDGAARGHRGAAI